LGDIDGDGDYDLLIGNLFGNISLYRNVGSKYTPEFVSGGKLHDNQNVLISSGSFARPYLYDIDFDGDLDLIVGGFNGKILLYQNNGNTNEYSFSKNLNYFGSIDVGDMSTPFLIDFDNDSVPELFIGNRVGLVKYYKNNGTIISPVWVEQENFLNSFTVGGDAAPYFVDIDNDTDFDFIIGNIKGGLYFFRNNEINSIKNNGGLLPNDFYISECYPNPFNSSTSFLLNVISRKHFSISVFNSLGEVVHELFLGELSPGYHSFTWDTDSNKSSSGVYFIVVKAGQLLKTVKVILLK